MSRVERLVLPLWGLFALVNLVLMFQLPGAETVPFHFVWVSMAIVYGVKPWGLARTYGILLLVCAVSTVALARSAAGGDIAWEELTEVPLMTCLFLAMVWHVRRRLAMTLQAQRLADSERRLREDQKRLVRFAAHELRTPVTVARGHTELIHDEYPDPMVLVDSELVIDELDKLERIVARLVTLAQVDQSPLLDVRVVDLDLLLEHCIVRWRATAERSWLLETHVGRCLVDPDRLAAALDCLLENAVRHTDACGQIRLTGARQRGDVVIEVMDDGEGLPPGAGDELFDCFHSSGEHAGTGIGLAIVKAIVEAQGGTVETGEAAGRGAMFTLRLPALRTWPSSSPGSAAQGVGQATRPIRVPGDGEALVPI